MTVLRSQSRPGAYYDSIVLMQLQVELAALPGILDAGAVMATPDNLALLAANDLLPDEPGDDPGPSDLLVVVKAEDEAGAVEALSRVDALLVRGSGDTGGDYVPRTLVSAVRGVPAARWALVSVPGRYAAGVAHEALDHGLNVFLYSDNVTIEDEVALKRRAGAEGRLVMGPDCGTAIVDGVGLGFANRVRRGGIGLVAASGTGLQAISTHVHALGGGISHAIGTGGRDLDARVGSLTCRQGLDLLSRDPDTEVIVLVSKPPVPSVARPVLAEARRCGKPVVVYFLGFAPPARRVGSVYFAAGLAEAAWMAVDLARPGAERRTPEATEPGPGDLPGYLRGLFSGGTLALELLQAVGTFVGPLHSNLSAPGVEPVESVSRSTGHTILDLGADEYTVGRLHPMIDHDLRLRRIEQEVADPDVGLILLDVVLGSGAHPDPAGALAPAIAGARQEREVEFVVLVVGTDEDPQDLESQIERLRASGAVTFEDIPGVLDHLVNRLAPRPPSLELPVDADVLKGPLAAINLGLETFASSLIEQGAAAVHVDWRPPAGGDERLISILDKLRR